jgi:hypothetical protein
MVPPTAGSYEFPCILTDGTVLKDGVTAEIKWAEEAGMIYDLYYNPETNKISFKTNGKKGNVLVALTTGGSAGDAIIWHWHLWITDAPKVVKVISSDNAKTYYLMDRVVGATWSPATAIETTSTVKLSDKDIAYNNTISLEDASNAGGLFFQYQNCNPYPRVKSLGWVGKEDSKTLVNTRCDVMYGFSQYSQFWSTSTSGGNVYKSSHVGDDQTLYIHNGVQLPNYMYHISGQTEDGGYKPGSNSSIWILDNIVNNKGLNSNNPVIAQGKYRFWCSWNENAQNHDNMMKGKTAHDPCPPGYILENYSNHYWYMCANVNAKAKFGYARAAENNATYASGYKFYGMYYNGGVDEAGNTVPLYWPCNGNRAGCVSSVSNKYANCGYIYSVNTNNDNAFVLKGKTYGNACAIAYGEVANDYTEPAIMNENANKIVNSQAYNVRCRRGKF